jgi:hypothetical protein
MSATIETQPPYIKYFATLNHTLLLVSLSFGILNFVLPIYGKQIGARAVEIGLHRTHAAW